MDLQSTFIFLLWICLSLFFLRVLGQLIVVIRRPSWLPSMSEWYSGLVPYWLLLPSQIIILILMVFVAVHFTRREGYFYVINPTTGIVLITLSAIYFFSMVVRYAIQRKRHPERGWFVIGMIPIVFHCVLALFLFLCGSFHRLDSIRLPLQ